MSSIQKFELEGGRFLCWARQPENVSYIFENTILSKSELSYLDTVKAKSRKFEWVHVRYLLQQFYPNATIEYNSTGRPTLNGATQSISISHSHGIVGLLFSESSFIGLDIEQPSSKLLRIAKRFVGEEEWSYLDTNNKTQLCVVWSAKEAIVKATGNKGIDFAKEILVKPFQVESTGQLEVEYVNDGVWESVFARYKILDDFVIVWLDC